MKAYLCLLIMVAARQMALGDTESGPFSYTAETADKKHIFVSLVSYDADSGLVHKGVTYRQSGMYLHDGSTTPLWTVDWLAYIYLPNGGEYVVRQGKWARYSGTYDEEAFSFISSGKLLVTYAARDLVVFPWLLPHSVSHRREA